MSVTITYWLAIGDISEAARLRVKSYSGFVRKIDNEQTSLYLVGIPCELDITQPGPGTPEVRVWVRNGREAIIEIPSKKLKFSWFSKRNILPTQASVSETTLDLYQEPE